MSEDNKTIIGFVKEIDYGTTPSKEKPITLLPTHRAPVIVGKVAREVALSARFGCPSCSAGIQIEVDTEINNPITEEGLLLGLVQLTDRESNEGKWRISLDYDNYHDGARVLDGNGFTIGECYDIDKEPNEQFLVAIERAIAAGKEQT